MPEELRSRSTIDHQRENYESANSKVARLKAIALWNVIPRYLFLYSQYSDLEIQRATKN